MKEENLKRSTKDYADKEQFWCPGCGHAGVLTAIMRWCARNSIDSSQLVDCTGIGCSSNIYAYHKCNWCHWLHGRAVPVATAIKIANPRLTVMVAGGDGDCAAIGTEHFIHTCRRNPDIVYIVMNNQVYGLTKGQISPTGHKDLVTPTTPKGAKDEPVDLVELAVVAGATFVARGYAYNQEQLGAILDRAFTHRGFSFVDVLSPCVTYHREETHETPKDWYEETVIEVRDVDRQMRSALTPIEEIDPDYDPANRTRALTVLSHAKQITWQTKDHKGRVVNMIGKLPTGIIYLCANRPTLEDNLGVSEGLALVELDLSPEKNRKILEELISSFR